MGGSPGDAAILTLTNAGATLNCRASPNFEGTPNSIFLMYRPLFRTLRILQSSLAKVHQRAYRGLPVQASLVLVVGAEA